MHINALKLKNFKRFEELEIKFNQGINVIMGHNEAGKTSIQEAILAGLFADPSTKARSLLDQITPWQVPTQSIIELEIASGNEEFSLIKDFQEKKAKLLNLKTNKAIDDISLIEKAILKLTNIPNQAIFESTALVRQSQIAQIETNKDFRKAIEKVASTSKDDNSIVEVNRKIDKQINDLTRGLNRPASNPGKIKELEIRLQELQNEYKEKQEVWKKVLLARTKGDDSSKDLGKIEEDIKILEELIQNQKIIDESEKEIEQLDKQNKRIVEVMNRLDTLKVKEANVGEKFKDYENYKLDELQGDADRVSNIKGQIEAKQKMIESLEAKEVRAQNQTRPKQANNSAKLIAIAVILASLTLGYFVDSIFLVGILIGLVLFVLLPSLQKNEQIQEEDYTSQIANVTNSLENDKTALNKILQQYQVSDIDKFFSKKIRFVTFMEEKNRITSEKKGVLGGRTESEFKNEQIEILSRKKEIEINSLTPEMKKSKLSPEEYLRKRRELDSLKIRKRTLERENIQSEVRVSESDVNMDDIIQLEEKLDHTQKTLSSAKHELEVLEIVIKALESSQSDISALIQEKVVSSMSEFLPKITNERYDQARIKDDFGLEIYSKEKGDWLDPANGLSAGTIDQVYFVYRLAMLKMIEGEAQVPLLLDDPFVTFDEARSASTLEILQSEARNRQILLFTHDKDFSSWGKLIEV